MKKAYSFKSVFDYFTIYRSSKIGISLISVLIELYKKRKIRTALIFRILNMYDQYINFLLKKKVCNTAKIKGVVEEYSNIDKIWYLTSLDFKFKTGLTIQRKKVRYLSHINISREKCYVMLIEKT
ncbi:TFIIA subunit gamma (nucleomorph) [Bigelowiella natans]|uniref:TFIIA subunit gamma n=1 Tax=Bigelowiella natans TaxID=227086 RepID=Q3LWJ9_BIGNA|nr:TFIIA subunit gamma [Bigelowiella natans]ABA27167.1 TFIIA subunit gamma [Bigelowiella natans]|mmetsp:Transcript_14952/g.23815  ORF Transcript_14952/g.23815 Transcript_14952/m.23815 type:complete len:125 (+) Transcript_14952:6815-7189(+)